MKWGTEAAGPSSPGELDVLSSMRAWPSGYGESGAGSWFWILRFGGISDLERHSERAASLLVCFAILCSALLHSSRIPNS